MTGEMLRFLFVGLFSNTINYVLYLLAKSSGASLVIASSVGYVAGLSVSFYFGRVWVFKAHHRGRGAALLRFLLVYFFGGLGMVSIIAALDRFFAWDYRLIWFVGAAFAVANNFVGSKWLVFDKGKD